MSLLKAIKAQLGLSNTPANNFTITAEADNGTLKLARGNAGATTQDILTVDAAGVASLPAGRNLLTLATVQNTTSGTVIDFTNIPAWVKRITVMFAGVSTNGTSSMMVQIGSGSIDTSTYLGSSTSLGAAAIATSSLSTGFAFIDQTSSAADARSGQLTLATLGSNIWTANGMIAKNASNYGVTCCGVKTLAGTLDRLRITTVNGTDTFDAGSVNIMYEG